MTLSKGNTAKVTKGDSNLRLHRICTGCQVSLKVVELRWYFFSLCCYKCWFPRKVLFIWMTESFCGPKLKNKDYILNTCYKLKALYENLVYNMCALWNIFYTVFG